MDKINNMDKQDRTHFALMWFGFGMLLTTIIRVIADAL